MKTLFAVLLALSLTACQTTPKKVATLENGIITANLKNFKDTVNLNLSDLIEDIEILQLDNGIGNYIASHAIFYSSNNYIASVGGNNSKYPVKLFEKKTGKFSSNIGSIGNGNGEYMHPKDVTICEDSQKIYIMAPTSRNSILVYDFNGTYLERIVLEAETNFYGTFSHNSKQGRISLVSESHKYTRPGIMQKSYSGEELAAHEIKLAKYAGIYFSSNDKCPNIHPYNLNNFPDTLFRYNENDNSLTPIFTLVLNNVSTVDDLDVSSISKRYFETSEYFFAWHSNISISANKGPIKSWYTPGPINVEVINKETLNGGHLKLTNDIILDPYNISPQITSNDLMIGYDATVLHKHLKSLTKEQRAKVDEQTLARIDRLVETIDPDGNTVVLLGKVK